MIDQATVQRILDTAEITEVVGEFVTLKRRGTNLLGLCPFHNEKTPSFNVSPAKGIYKCFGCGKGGSAVNFIMEHEHLSFVESLRWLGEKIPHREFRRRRNVPKISRSATTTRARLSSRSLHRNILLSSYGRTNMAGPSDSATSTNVVSGMRSSKNSDWVIVLTGKSPLPMRP